jgi:hypothetical protein
MSSKQTRLREFEECLQRLNSVSRNSRVTGANGSKIETQLTSNSGHWELANRFVICNIIIASRKDANILCIDGNLNY